MPLTCYSGPEAREWLAKVAAPRGFAPNRFASTEEAVAFVEALYAAGAASVFVPADDVRDHPKLRAKFGGATANSVVVTLPADEQRRRAVLASCLAEAASEGYDAGEEDVVVDGKYVYLWWD